MARKIYLNGEMANKFGTVHPFVGDTVQEAIRLLSANNSEFRPYLFKCMENDIQFSVTVHGKELDDIKECLLPLKEGDIIITPIIAGSKSGGAKIAAALVITLLLSPVAAPMWQGMGALSSSSTSVWAAGMAGNTAQVFATMAAGNLAAGLAMAGIQQIMAPDPAVDKEEEKGYMLNGAEQNIVEGDPVPVLYGELRGPGRPISFEVRNENREMFSENIWRYNNLDPNTILTTDSFNNNGDDPGAGALELHQFHLDAIDDPAMTNSITTYGSNLSVYGKNQQMYIIDLLSEGPIYGPVEGSASVYLNDDRAIDSGHAAAPLSFTAATFDFTQGQKTVTYHQNSSDYVFTEESSIRYLNIIDYITVDNVEAVQTGVVVGGGVKVNTGGSNLIFVESMKHNNAFSYQNQSTRIMLTQDGVEKYSGSIANFASTASFPVNLAYLKHSSFNLPDGWEDTDGWDPTDPSAAAGTAYKLHMDQAIAFKVNASGNIILEENWPLANVTGVKANVTGIEVPIDSLHKGITSKNPGFSFNFLNGDKNQKPLVNSAGLGWGVTAIGQGSSFSSTSIQGPLSGNQHTVELQGISDYGFGLSADQAEETDEIRVLFQYSQLHNKRDGSARDQDGKAFYQIDVKFSEDGTNFDDYIPIFTEENPLRHRGMSKSAIAAEVIVDLKNYSNGPFADFKLRIKRLSEDNKAYYSSFSKPPAGSDYTSNTQCSITNLTSILKENLSYPYTSLAKVSVNSKNFQSPPKRTYHLRGLKVKIPSNYVTRERAEKGVANYNRSLTAPYSETSSYVAWDGNFQASTDYTNNPAWIFYDIVTNNRYGLGHWLQDSDIDKFALYRIARYCDELVPDGSGLTPTTANPALGMEPRFTCNVYFQKSTDAYKVLKDLTTVFRGMLYWLDGNIFPIMDEPKDPVYNFTAGNVINGQFSYESTGSKTRSNQVIVTWVNPEQDYKQEALLVEDKENIISTGKIISQKASAFGATTEGQALRYGRWKLWTAKNQTEVASFQTSINAAFLRPGDIVNIQDASRSPAKVQYSGRIKTVSGGNNSTLIIPLDRKIALISGSTYELSVLIEEAAVFLTQESATLDTVPYSRGDLIPTDRDGNAINTANTTEQEALNLLDDSGDPVLTAWQPHTRIESRGVTTTAGIDKEQLTVSPAFSVIPKAKTIWALREVAGGVEVDGSKKIYKILSISEDDADKYSITAVEHYNEKFESLDKDFILSTPETVTPSVPDATQTVPPPDVVYAVVSDKDNDGSKNDVTLYWDPPTVSGERYRFIAKYEIAHNVDGVTNPLPVNKDKTSAEGFNVPPGTYDLGIRTVNTGGHRSKYVPVTVTVVDDGQDSTIRQYGIPMGGSVSREIFLTDSTHKFRVAATPYKFISSGSLLTINEPTVGSSPFPNSIQDCSSIGAVDYGAGGYNDYAKALLSHYMFFDASATSDHLKLIKYYKDSNLNLEYWYDTGPGNLTPGSNFNIASTGTVSVAANSQKVVGTSTTFESDYEVGDIIYFSATKAGIVNHIASDTDLRIDRGFSTAVAASSSHYCNKFKFDRHLDSVFATIRNDSNAGFSLDKLNLDIDRSLNDSARIANFTVTPNPLHFDGASTPVYNGVAHSNLVLVAEAEGFQNPEFKITGTGFNHTDISQSADTTYHSATVDNSRTLNLDDIETYSSTDLLFNLSIRETDDPTNTAKIRTRSIEVPFMRDGATGSPGATGGDGSAGINAKAVSLAMGDQTFEYDTEGNTPSPTSTTVTATPKNTSGTVYYRFYLNDVAQGSGFSTTNTYTYTPTATHADMPEKIEVEISNSSNGSPVLATDQIAALGLKAGSDAIVTVLSNEAHTLPTTNLGVVDYTGTGTNIQVWRGVTQLDYGSGNNEYTVDAVGTDIGVGSASTISGSDGGEIRVFADSTSTPGMTEDVASIEYTIKVYNLTGAAFQTFHRIQSFAKSHQGGVGATGDDAKVVQLTSDDYSIVYDEEGENPTPSSITLTASSKHFTDPWFKFTLDGTAEGSYSDGTDDDDTATFSIPSLFSSWSDTPKTMAVSVSEGDQTEVAFDTISIYPVKSGDDAHTGYLTNQAHVVSANYNGTTYNLTGSGGTFEMYDGAVDKTGSATTYYAGPSGTSLSVTKNGLTMTIAQSTGVYTLSGGSWTSDYEEFTLRGIYDGVTITLVYSIAKSKDGASGSRGYSIFTIEESSNSSVSATNAAAFAGSLTDSDANAIGGAVMALADDGYIRPNDRITVTDNSANLAGTRVYTGSATNTATDADAANFSSLVVETFDGSVIVDGTLAAGKLVSDFVYSKAIQVGAGGPANFEVATTGNMHSGHADFADAPFSITAGGVLKAEEGLIGGWTIDDNKLYDGKSSITDQTAGIFFGQTGIALGPAGVDPKFKVTAAGAMTADNVTLTGYSNSLVASSIKLMGDDKVDIGNGAEITVGGTSYNVVGAFIDGGSSDTAGVVGICSVVGVAGQGATGGVYGETGGSSNSWGWLGHSSAGLFANSFKLDGWSAPITGSSSSGWLQHDGTWTTPTGTLPTQSDPGTVDKFLQSDGTDASWVTAGGTGTVTSVATGNGLTGGPIITTGTISIPDNAIGTDELNVTGNGNTFQFLRSDGDGSFTWAMPAYYDNDDVDTHLNTSSASTNEVLSWNGSDYDWVSQSGGGSGDIERVNIAAGAGLSGSVDTLSGPHNQTLKIDNLGVTNAMMADDAVGIPELSAGGTASTSTFLRGDNSWETPPDTNTTYTASTGLVLNGTAFSNTGVTSIVAGSGISINAATGAVTVTATGGGGTSDGYLSALAFNTSTGVLTATVTGAANPTVDLDGRYSTTDTTYTAGTGMSLSGTTFNCTVTDTNTITSLNAGGGAQTGAITFNGSGVSQSGATFTFTDTNTTYQGGAGMALSGTTFNIGGGTGINVAADEIAVDMGDFDTDDLSQGSTNKYYSDTLVNTRLAGSISTGAVTTSGAITATGNITAFNSSDIALKEDLNPISNALDKVMSISGYNFSWKDSNIKERGGEDGYFVRKKDVGIVAQEIEKILPEAVADREDGTKGVRYELLVPLLVNAIKELKEKVEELEDAKSSK